MVVSTLAINYDNGEDKCKVGLSAGGRASGVQAHCHHDGGRFHHVRWRQSGQARVLAVVTFVLLVNYNYNNLEELWELNKMREELAEWDEARALTDEVSETKGDGWV